MRPAVLDSEKVFGNHHGPPLIGAHGEILEVTDSTMDVARDRLREGAPDGYVVIAEEQTGGRGRQGTWVCPAGQGLLMSVVLRPRLAAAEQNLVMALGSVAVTEAVRRLGLPAEIKWPNDVVMAEDTREGVRVRKVGGLLVQRVTRRDRPAGYVLGIGLNVNQQRGDLPLDAPRRPTSLRLEGGRPYDRSKVARVLLQELNYWYQRLRMGQPERILARWRRLSCLLLRRVRVLSNGAEMAGTVVGIRRSGELIFRDQSGRRSLLSERSARLLV
jgi:BirA family biotin operon repressor/biotin-[acetyl-CoA-carboxylase] ligase